MLIISIILIMAVVFSLFFNIWLKTSKGKKWMAAL